MVWVPLAGALSGCGHTDLAGVSVEAGEAVEAPQTARSDVAPPPFTQATVLALNSIVGRSLTVAQEYDGAIRVIRRAVDVTGLAGAPPAARTEAETALAALAALDGRAKAARDDLRVAVEALEASGEAYDAELLGGMVGFVADVEAEIAQERSRLARLADR